MEAGQLLGYAYMTDQIITLFSEPERVYTTLKIYHEDLIPSEVSAALNLQPTDSQRKGDPLLKPNGEPSGRHVFHSS